MLYLPKLTNSLPEDCSRRGTSYVPMEAMSAWPPTNHAVSSQVVVLTSLKLYLSSHLATIPVSFM